MDWITKSTCPLLFCKNLSDQVSYTSPQVLPWHSGWTVGICVDNTLTRSRDRQAGSLPLRVTTLPHAVFLLTPEAAAAACCCCRCHHHEQSGHLHTSLGLVVPEVPRGAQTHQVARANPPPLDALCLLCLMPQPAGTQTACYLLCIFYAHTRDPLAHHI